MTLEGPSRPRRPRWPAAGAALAAAIALALPATTAAETYHVAPDGDDAAAGTESDPFRSLQQAADSVGPGDEVVVRAGTYRGFHLETSGTESEPIVLSADPGVLVNKDNPVTTDGINLEGVAHVVVEGFTVERTSRAGIRAVECADVTIRGNRSDDNYRWGIFTAFCDDLVIEDNETSRSEDEHGIYVSNSGDRPVIRDNVIWGNNGNGIHMNGDVNFGGDGLISDAVVEGNIIFDNGKGGGSAINCDGVQDSVFRNNLLHDNHAAGISLYAIDGAEGSKRNVVVNNTIVMASGARWAVQIRNGSTDNTIVNNLLLNPHAFRGAIVVDPASTGGLVADHNAGVARYSVDDGETAMDLAEWRSAGYGASSFAASLDDLFVDPAGRDYHLAADSPAIDAGSNGADLDVDLGLDSAADVGLDGNARGLGAGVDVGAFEHCDGDCQPSDPAPTPGDGDSDEGSGGTSPSDPGPGGDPNIPADDPGAPMQAGMACSIGAGAGTSTAPVALFFTGLILARRRRCGPRD